jgi:hypothetical protein
MKRRISIAAACLMVAAATMAVSVTAASAAKPVSGEWKVRPGKTLHLTNMNINAGDSDSALIRFDHSAGTWELGNNFGGGGNVQLSDYSYTNSDGSAHTVTLGVYDHTQSCGFFSDGTNAIATRTAVSISDGGGSCDSNLPPLTLGQGNFNATVSVGRTH